MLLRYTFLLCVMLKTVLLQNQVIGTRLFPLGKFHRPQRAADFLSDSLGRALGDFSHLAAGFGITPPRYGNPHRGNGIWNRQKPQMHYPPNNNPYIRPHNSLIGTILNPFNIFHNNRQREPIAPPWYQDFRRPVTLVTTQASWPSQSDDIITKRPLLFNRPTNMPANIGGNGEIKNPLHVNESAMPLQPLPNQGEDNLNRPGYPSGGKDPGNEETEGEQVIETTTSKHAITTLPDNEENNKDNEDKNYDIDVRFGADD